MHSISTFYITALSLGLFLCPSFVHAASIEITEVMYDVEGTDSDREWIEVYNTTNAGIDFVQWNFVENDINHGISAEDENMLPGRSYAVVADNPASFLQDFPDFSGIIFDSAFALSNSGEELALRTSQRRLFLTFLFNLRKLLMVPVIHCSMPMDGLLQMQHQERLMRTTRFHRPKMTPAMKRRGAWMMTSCFRAMIRRREMPTLQ